MMRHPTWKAGMLKTDRYLDRDPGSGRNAAGYRIPSSLCPLLFSSVRHSSIQPASHAAMHVSKSKCIATALSKTKGWTVKALEFINSGAPALLNNSRRSHRRVVIIPFLKHAMEVHHG